MSHATAMTGSLDSRVISERRDVSNGRAEFEMEHFFINENGSTIFTKDKSFIRAPRPVRSLPEDRTTRWSQPPCSRFEGMRGTFHSGGSWLFDKGIGVLRFEVHISLLVNASGLSRMEPHRQYLKEEHHLKEEHCYDHNPTN